jgi:hypothetical protein
MSYIGGNTNPGNYIGSHPVIGIASSFPSFRNRIINGGLQIAQRGTSHQHDIYGSGALPYNLDRFCSGRTNIINAGNAIITQIAGGGQKHAIYQSTATLASDVFFTIRQHIEGFNCFDLAGKQVTVSFKVKTNKAGNYGVSFYDGTGSTAITPQSITVSSADASAENKVSYSKTFTMPSSITADNASRLRLDICLAAHSSREGEYYPTGGSQVNLFDSTSNYFEIYEIQLEEGTVATPFEHRPTSVELSLAQRYYQKSFPMDVAPAQNIGGNGALYCQGHAANAPASGFVIFPTPMRDTPSIFTTYNPSAANANWRNLATATDINKVLFSSSSSGFFLYSNTQVLSQYQVAAIHWSAHAEL